VEEILYEMREKVLMVLSELVGLIDDLIVVVEYLYGERELEDGE